MAVLHLPMAQTLSFHATRYLVAVAEVADDVMTMILQWPSYQSAHHFLATFATYTDINRGY